MACYCPVSSEGAWNEAVGQTNIWMREADGPVDLHCRQNLARVVGGSVSVSLSLKRSPVKHGRETKAVLCRSSREEPQTELSPCGPGLFTVDFRRPVGVGGGGGGGGGNQTHQPNKGRDIAALLPSETTY